jgi:hypothetical protein
MVHWWVLVHCGRWAFTLYGNYLGLIKYQVPPPHPPGSWKKASCSLAILALPLKYRRAGVEPKVLGMMPCSCQGIALV